MFHVSAEDIWKYSREQVAHAACSWCEIGLMCVHLIIVMHVGVIVVMYVDVITVMRVDMISVNCTDAH